MLFVPGSLDTSYCLRGSTLNFWQLEVMLIQNRELLISGFHLEILNALHFGKQSLSLDFFFIVLVT